MDQLKELFEKEMEVVTNAYPSIYTKDDVIMLLTSLKDQVSLQIDELTPVSCGISEKLFTEFQTKVRDTMESYFEQDTYDCIDYDSPDFSIDYNNRLQLENINLNVENISIKLDEVMLTCIEDVFGDLLILDQQ